MLLTITTTHRPADDLGYLLAKHPDRVHTSDLPFGTATVFFPVADAHTCTAALLVEVDPIALVRRAAGVGSGAGKDGFTLGQHVNDRPYAASSMLSVAIARTLGSALGGRSRERPELADTKIPLEITLPAVRDADELAGRLFEPLGWRVERTPAGSTHTTLRLTGTLRLADALSHVYLLVPVMDDAKHYPVGADEAEKLLRAGGDWLPTHPERELIGRRYLRYRRRLTLPALEALGVAPEPETAVTPLRELRRSAVVDRLRRSGARRVLDLGCGDGALLAALLRDPAFTEIVGVDTSAAALERAARRLRLDELPPAARDRITLLHGSLTYRDERLTGYDAAVLMEVVEHLDADRLPALCRCVFGVARPGEVIVTTPNREYNAHYPGLAPGALRHPDHRFEWTRAEFRAWCEAVGAEYGYRVGLGEIGGDAPGPGSPTQLATFTRDGSEGAAA